MVASQSLRTRKERERPRERPGTFSCNSLNYLSMVFKWQAEPCGKDCSFEDISFLQRVCESIAFLARFHGASFHSMAIEDEDTSDPIGIARSRKKLRVR